MINKNKKIRKKILWRDFIDEEEIEDEDEEDEEDFQKFLVRKFFFLAKKTKKNLLTVMPDFLPYLSVWE